MSGQCWTLLRVMLAGMVDEGLGLSERDGLGG